MTLVDLLAVASGSLVGLSLGLIGGGGSILAVPLLVYVVGVPVPHMAIGTSALAVAVNAVSGLIGHARSGNVKWRCAIVFAAAGVAGALVGSMIGKAVDGERLIGLFGLVMIAVGIAMLIPRKGNANAEVQLTAETAPRLLPRLIGFGFLVGMLSGFFGIGGGFLIVPGLMGATAMPILYAVGSSLVSVASFGFTTAASYAWSGLVDWVLAGQFILGGLAGGLIGTWAAKRLGTNKRTLNVVFSAIVILVGLYVAGRGFLALG